MLGEGPRLEDCPRFAVGRATPRRHCSHRRLPRDCRFGGFLLFLGSDARTRRFINAILSDFSAAHKRVEFTNAPDQAAPQETHQQNKDDAENQLPGAAEMEGGLQKVA